MVISENPARTARCRRAGQRIEPREKGGLTMCRWLPVAQSLRYMFNALRMGDKRRDAAMFVGFSADSNDVVVEPKN